MSPSATLKTGKKPFAAVPLWKVFGKAQTRSWADENGLLLLTSGEPGAEFFTLEKVQELLTPESSYLLKAPGQGSKHAVLNLAAGLDVAAAQRADSAACGQTTGMEPVFAELMELQGPLHALQAGRGDLDKNASRPAAETLMQHFGRKSSAEERLAQYATLADAATRMAGAAFTCMELTALAVAVKDWGKHLESGDMAKQHATWKRFTSKPNLDTLAAAFAAGIHTEADEKGEMGGPLDGTDMEDAVDASAGTATSFI